MQEEQYPTTEEGYASFIEWCHKVEEEYEVKVEMAIEATGNARYLRHSENIVHNFCKAFV